MPRAAFSKSLPKLISMLIEIAVGEVTNDGSCFCDASVSATSQLSHTTTFEQDGSDTGSMNGMKSMLPESSPFDKHDTDLLAQLSRSSLLGPPEIKLDVRGSMLAHGIASRISTMFCAAAIFASAVLELEPLVSMSRDDCDLTLLSLTCPAFLSIAVASSEQELSRCICLDWELMGTKVELNVLQLSASVSSTVIANIVVVQPTSSASISIFVPEATLGE
jgi:hypothetical protein